MLYFGDDLIELAILCELHELRKENEYLKECIKEGSENVICAVCGQRIENVSMQRATRPILWHNRNCFTWKPRKIVKLEQDFGIDIVEILKETAKRCGNIRAQCEFLGISIPYLYSIIRKYCGEDFLTFMAKNTAGRRRELYAKKLQKKDKK